MKFPLAWHKDCLNNRLTLLDAEIRRLQHVQDDVENLKAEVNFYQYQIEEAEKKHKDGFDSDKWCKRKPD